MAKQMPNATKPLMAITRSWNVLGTSSETTSSVTAKANTASVNPSSRVISPPRQRKCFSGGTSSVPIRPRIMLFLLSRYCIEHRVRWSFLAQLSLPARDHRCRQAVAENVGRGARHIHELINAENHQHRPRGEIERGHRAHQDHDHGPRHSGDAFAGQHERQYDYQLLG